MKVRVPLALVAAFASPAGAGTRQAVAVLPPGASDAEGEAFALVMQGRGYAHSMKGELPAAEKLLRRAEAAAYRPAEWRTRAARARLDLGMLLVRSGRVDEAHAILLSAKRGGLEGYIAARRDSELTRMVAEAEVAQAGKRLDPFRLERPPEASPFLVDGAGRSSATAIRRCRPACSRSCGSDSRPRRIRSRRASRKGRRSPIDITAPFTIRAATERHAAARILDARRRRVGVDRGPLDRGPPALRWVATHWEQAPDGKWHLIAGRWEPA